MNKMIQGEWADSEEDPWQTLEELPKINGQVEEEPSKKSEDFPEKQEQKQVTVTLRKCRNRASRKATVSNAVKKGRQKVDI